MTFRLNTGRHKNDMTDNNLTCAQKRTEACLD